MNTPAAAIAWELRQRHRWGLIALLATILTLGGIKLAVLTTQAHPELHDVTFVLLVPVPLAATFLYLLAVFTFGISGDLSLLFLFRDTPVIVIEIVIMALLMPPFLAIFVAATVGKSSANASESYGITPFIATRPVEDRALVLAKWQVALLSTLAAWAIVAAAVPVALLWSDATEPIIHIARNVDGALGRPRAIILGLLILAGLVGSTWKQLVQGLYIAMSGRDWAVKGIAFATLASVTAGFLALGWILNSRYRIVVAWSAIPWLMVAFVSLKLVLAMRVMQRGAERGLFMRKQLIVGAIAWDVCVLALYGVLALILPDILFRRSFLLLVAMLVVPFVRLAAAPLAVARNRHR